jgi:polysaccharide biosynthesis protein PslH
MNILFLSTRSPYPLISGHSLRTYHILKGAAEHHNVILVTFIQHPEHELRAENLAQLRSFCKAVYTFQIPSDVSKINLIASIIRNLFSLQPFVAHKYDASLMRSKIREIIATEGINLVHVDMLPLAVYINEFPDLPRILVNHNVESVRLFRWFETEQNLFKKLFLGFQWLKLRRFERLALNSFDCCVTVSENDKNILGAMGVNKPMVVVPNGTDTEFFKPMGRPTIPNSVLWFGHMDVHTNLDAVLYFWREIYPLLRKQMPDVIVSFVGTAPPLEIADVSRHDPNVRVTGFVDDIRPFVDEAAVVVVPIRIGGGTRLKILDALAMGKAIVSTSVGCEGLELTKNQEIVVADSPDEMCANICNLLINHDERQMMVSSALNAAKRYDWKLIVSNQEDVYKEAVERRSL